MLVDGLLVGFAVAFLCCMFTAGPLNSSHIMGNLQNPLTSRATVVDCSDRRNGAQVPKPIPIPEPKLKPDVRPGKVPLLAVCRLNSVVATTLYVRHYSQQLPPADSPRERIQSDGLDETHQDPS